MSHRIPLTTGEVLTLPVGHLSPSALDTYLKCPMVYYWRYVEGRKDPPGIAMVNGSAGHMGLEINNRHKKKTGEDLPTKTVVEAYADTLSDKWVEVEDKEGLTKDGVIKTTSPAIANYMEEDAPSILPVGVEQPFQIDVQGLPVRGFIDIVAESGWVSDYKFPKSRRSPYLKQDTAEASIQLATYGRAMGTEKVGYHLMLPVEHLKTKTNPGECRRITTKFTPAKWLEAEEMYLSVARAISAGAFPLCPPNSWNCSPKFCGYYHRCRGCLRAGDPIKRGAKGARNAAR